MNEAPKGFIESITDWINDIKESFDNVEGSSFLEKLFNLFAKKEELEEEVTEETAQEFDALATEITSEYINHEVQGNPENYPALVNAFILGASHSVGINRFAAPNGVGFSGQPSSRFRRELPGLLEIMGEGITHVVFPATVNNVWNIDPAQEEQAIEGEIEDYEAMIAMVRASGREPVLCTVINITGEPEDKIQRVRDLNKEVRTLARRTGVTLVDLETSVSSSALHPGPSGYRQMAEEINDAIS